VISRSFLLVDKKMTHIIVPLTINRASVVIYSEIRLSHQGSSLSLLHFTCMCVKYPSNFVTVLVDKQHFFLAQLTFFVSSLFFIKTFFLIYKLFLNIFTMSSNKNPDAEELSIIKHVHTGKPYEDQCVICLTWIDLSKRSNINHTNTKASCYQVNECRHTICTDCLAQYMVCALTDTRYITNCRNNDNSNTFDYIQCPSGDCEETFDADDIVRDIFSVDEANKWWRSAYLRNYMSYKVGIEMKDINSSNI
jgi:hypothetical protein